MEDLLHKLQQSLRPASLQDFTPPGHSRHQIKDASARRVLIHNAPFIFTCNTEDHIEVLKNHSLIIENDTVREVRPAADIKTADFDYYYDAGKRGGIVITPGLVNTHAHCHMYLMRSAMMLDEGEGIDDTINAMSRWLARETDESYAIAAIGDLTEQQKYGITTTLTHGPSFVSGEAGARLSGHHLINAVSAISNSRPANNPATVEKILNNKNKYYSTPAIAIHYLYKATLADLQTIKTMSAAHQALLTFHMAESEQVAAKTVANHGCREVALLAKVGLLNDFSLASHALYLSEDEIETLAKNQVGIAHLPTSNTIHKSGLFRFWLFDKYGGSPCLSLGTDSVVSKSRLDILTEAYQARITHLYERTVKFSALFKMMTANGARVLHEPQRGKILPGFKADLAFWKIKDRGFIPYDAANPITLLGNLVTHGGRTVRDLMIDGRFVIKDRRHQLIDESKLLAEIQKAHMDMRARVK